MKIEKSLFGTTKNGEAVYNYRLYNGEIEADVLSYGGILQKLIVKDKDSHPTDVLLGYDTLKEYEEKGGYLCALIGRFGNRIEKGHLEIDGKTYELYCNDRGNHLHGGKEGFNAKIWQVNELENGLELTYFSKDGEENYPGNLLTKVRYLLDGNALKIEYEATTDQKTAINLTNHAYFNLSGEGNGDVLSHTLQFFAPYYVPTDETMIPHGELKKVDDTPFDFRAERKIGVGDALRSSDRDLSFGGGYDHAFVFEKDRDKNHPVVIAYSKESGIEMSTFTSLPSVQFYGGNGLNHKGKGGKRYGRCYGFCLETQMIPNNVNVEKYREYGSSYLDEGECFSSFTTYSFKVR